MKQPFFKLNNIFFLEKILSSKVPYLMLVLVFIVYAGYKSLNAQWFLEDAMITMQYSKNIALGHGYSFNLGKNDFATTSILHTLACVPCFYLTDRSETALRWVKINEVIIVSAGLLLFYFLFLEFQFHPFIAALFAILTISNKNIFYHLFSGMEMSWYFLAIAITLYAAIQNRRNWVGIMAALLYLIRPEGVLLVIIIGLYDLFENRSDGFLVCFKRWVRPFGLMLLILVPFAAYFYLTKGKFLADTAQVKILTARNWGLYYTFLPKLVQDMSIWFVISLIGLCTFPLKNKGVLLMVLFCVGNTILFIVAKMPKSPWYYIPFNMGLICFITIGLHAVFNNVCSDTLKKSVMVVILSVVLFFLPVTGLRAINSAGRSMREIQEQRTMLNRKVGEWLANNTAEDVRVGVPNIGYIGFYAEREIVDLVGLITPDIARSRPDDPGYWYRKYKPDYIVDKIKYEKKFLNNPNYYRVLQFGKEDFGDEGFSIFKHTKKPPQ